MKTSIAARRRVLAGLCGLGLLPVTAAAQTAEVQEYICTVYSKSPNGKERLEASVTGQNAKTISKHSSEYKIPGRRTTASEPFSNVLGRNAFGVFTLFNTSGVQGTKPEFPDDAKIYIGDFTYTGDWPDSSPFDAEFAFDFSDGKPLRFPGKIYKSSGGLSAYVSFKLSEHLSPNELRTFLEKWNETGSLALVVFDPTGQSVWLSTAVDAINFSAYRGVIKIAYKQAADQFGTKSCREASSCFLTTAASQAVGLSDDCWELETLRKFRDGPLMALPEGKALIAQYYRSAPDLVETINARHDARKIWLRLYVTGIIPSAIYCKLGFNKLALSRYRAMTTALARKTSPG